jgi:hypothetical protein
MTKKKTTAPADDLPTVAARIGSVHLEAEGLTGDALPIDWLAADAAGVSLVDRLRAELEATTTVDDLEARRVQLEDELAAARAEHEKASADFAESSSRQDWKRAEEAASEVARLEAVIAATAKRRSEADEQAVEAKRARAVHVHAVTLAALLAKLEPNHELAAAAQRIVDAVEALVAAVVAADAVAEDVQRLRVAAARNAGGAGAPVPAWHTGPAATVRSIVRTAAVGPETRELLAPFGFGESEAASERERFGVRAAAPDGAATFTLRVRGEGVLVVDLADEIRREEEAAWRRVRFSKARDEFEAEAIRRYPAARDEFRLRMTNASAAPNAFFYERERSAKRSEREAAEDAERAYKRVREAFFRFQPTEFGQRCRLNRYPAELCDERVADSDRMPSGWDPLWPAGKPEIDFSGGDPAVVAIPVAESRMQAPICRPTLRDKHQNPTAYAYDNNRW